MRLFLDTVSWANRYRLGSLAGWRVSSTSAFLYYTFTPPNMQRLEKRKGKKF
ncbi:hypothetical protein [Sporomusa acidovorans]|uniref:hypothetical protein n=1 Tax=Sporomusa acidovorans TaxID=112900 RepID=UPI0015A279F5|nr:hypothetical protein [Sporomusa acidovorans]